LIRRNYSGSHKGKPICQNLGNNLKLKISNCYWPVIFDGFNTLNLRNKRYHITVNSRENPVLLKKLLDNIAKQTCALEHLYPVA